MEHGLGAHPSAAALQAFGKGKLDENAARELRAHLADCPECRARLSVPGTANSPGGLPTGASSAGTPLPDLSLSGVASSLRIPVGPQAQTPPPPKELAGDTNYQILRELGRGGMGVVYLAHDTVMDRKVVLKVVAAEHLARPQARERFLGEIRAAAKLDHPNVVKAFATLQPGGLLVFVMEYVDGVDLHRLVKERGALPVAAACYYAYQAALGLQHAHEQGMVHRDIKPHNLMLARGKKNQVKILDFGLAKANSEKGDERGLTATGQMLGTPDYVSPEQTLDAASATIRADIYSLGCTLYYLLAGRPPFTGRTAFEVMQAHHDVDARPLSEARADVPAGLDGVVRKMMAKDPADRYQTPVEAARALAQFVKPGSGPAGAVQAEPVTPQETRVAAAGSTEVAAARKTRSPAADHPSTAVESPAPRRRATPPPRTRQQDEEEIPAVEPASWPSRHPFLTVAGVSIVALVMAALLIVPLVLTTQLGAGGSEAVIVLGSVPSGADVFLNGERVPPGAPASNGGFQLSVRPGETHRLEVRKRGFERFAREVTVNAGQTLQVPVTLLPLAPVASATAAGGATPATQQPTPRRPIEFHPPPRVQAPQQPPERPWPDPPAEPKGNAAGDKPAPPAGPETAPVVERDTIKEKLEAAKAEYKVTMDKLRGEVLAKLREAEDEARASGKASQVTRAEMARKDFETKGTVPSVAPAGYQQNADAARDAVLTAYRTAAKAYQAAGKFDKAEAVEQERKSLARAAASDLFREDSLWQGTGKVKVSGLAISRNWPEVRLRVTERSGKNFKALLEIPALGAHCMVNGTVESATVQWTTNNLQAGGIPVRFHGHLDRRMMLQFESGQGARGLQKLVGVVDLTLQDSP